MIIELIIALIVGILCGTITGISPGIHINLVSALLVSSLPYFQQFSLISLSIFIVSMSITHTFIDFIPSIFLGAPEEDNFLSILPGHKLLLEGKGHEAFLLTLKGSLLAIPLILILSIPFIYLLPIVYSSIKEFIPFLLIFLSIYLIFREDNFFISFTIFVLSGILGLLTFNLPVEQPLLPLLSGLFGLSSLVISIKTSSNPLPQRIYLLKEAKLSKREYFKSSLSSFIFAPLCSFLPGIGSGHAATMASEFTEQNPKQFLFSLGIINTIVMGLSYVTVYSINKARTGTAAGVKELLKTISSNDLTIILISIILSGIFAFIIALFLSRLFAKFMNKINYKTLNYIIISILLIVNIFLTNSLGLLVLLTSSCLGIFAVLSNSRRINLMACLILPSITYYLLN
jgi:putative membrane protein